VKTKTRNTVLNPFLIWTNCKLPSIAQ
jgi:hypothetical protein